MTKLLFWENPYCEEFDAKVLKVEGNNIILDQTCFYAESGGQPGDTGLLGDVKIIDTKYSPDKRTVFHVVSEQPELVADQQIVGKIDWDRRYKLMRLHSALHLTYELFIRKYGTQKLIGSSISDSKARVDFEYYDSVDVKALKDEISEIISQNLPINVEASKEDPYKRYWNIQGFNPVPCGGTHPKNTSEIGNLDLKLKSLGKQGQRIYVSLR